MDEAIVAANDDAESRVDPVQRAAAFWVARLTSGDATAEEREKFRRWRDRDRAHAKALAEARSLWLTLGPAIEADKAEVAAESRWSRLRFGALAASLAVAVIGGVAAKDRYGHDHVTGAGERRTIVLADGTRVTLAGASAIDVAFDNGRRRVKLVRGEAYFDVVYKPSQPFEVDAGPGRISDVGTAFSVRRENVGAAVEVARGAVKVSSSDPVRRLVILTANQAVEFGADGPGAVHRIDAAKELSWIDGRLVIESKTLANAVADINRYYDGRIILLRDASRGRPISAVVDLDNIDDWLAALDRTGTAKVFRLGKVVLLH